MPRAACRPAGTPPAPRRGPPRPRPAAGPRGSRPCPRAAARAARRPRGFPRGTRRRARPRAATPGIDLAPSDISPVPTVTPLSRSRNLDTKALRCVPPLPNGTPSRPRLFPRLGCRPPTRDERRRRRDATQDGQHEEPDRGGPLTDRRRGRTRRVSAGQAANPRPARIPRKPAARTTAPTPAARDARPPATARATRLRRDSGGPHAGALTSNSTSRTPQGTKRASISMPGTPKTTVRTKKSRQPRLAASTPATGPARIRGSVNRLESSAYWVAEKRLSVSRISSTPKAPCPRPLEPSSNAIAAYMSSRLVPPTWATAAYPRFENSWKKPKTQSARPRPIRSVAQPPTKVPTTIAPPPATPAPMPTSTSLKPTWIRNGPRERLGEVVAELVEHHECEDLERPVLGEEADERPPHRLAERPRRRREDRPARVRARSPP